MSQYLFYRSRPGDPSPTIGPAPAELDLEVWRPAILRLVPPGMPGCLPAMVWSVLHFANLFANRAYAIVLIRHGAQVVHRSFVFPRYFRFPFMSPEDVQVGDTWTDPAWRGRGLARAALLEVCRRAIAEGRCVWYVTEENNAPSRCVAESCGFHLYGRGIRTSRCNLRVFGAFVPSTPSPPAA